MLKIRKAYGIPEELTNAIEKLYKNTRARILSPGGETCEFEILAGVLQGDTLAPFLFTIVLDYILKQALDQDDNKPGFTIEQRRIRRYPAVKISDLDFADDIALSLDSIEEAQTSLINVENVTAKVGFHLNSDKTECMVFNQEHHEPMTRTNEKIRIVQDFKYLGAWLDDSEKDFKTRKVQAWVACNKLSKVWKNLL